MRVLASVDAETDYDVGADRFVKRKTGTFGDKTCRHGVLIGEDCRRCLESIRAIGRGEPDQHDGVKA